MVEHLHIEIYIYIYIYIYMKKDKMENQTDKNCYSYRKVCQFNLYYHLFLILLYFTPNLTLPIYMHVCTPLSLPLWHWHIG